MLLLLHICVVQCSKKKKRCVCLHCFLCAPWTQPVYPGLGYFVCMSVYVHWHCIARQCLSQYRNGGHIFGNLCCQSKKHSILLMFRAAFPVCGVILKAQALTLQRPSWNANICYYSSEWAISLRTQKPKNKWREKRGSHIRLRQNGLPAAPTQQPRQQVLCTCMKVHTHVNHTYTFEVSAMSKNPTANSPFLI